MKNLLPALFVLCAAAAPASADHYQKYWPLDSGNSWTYSKTNPAAKFAPYAVGVTSTWQGLAFVENFPGLEDGAWFGWSGNNLWVWDPNAAQWKIFLKCGVGAGTKYTVNLGRPLWSSVEVTLKSKATKYYDAQLNRNFYNCLRFTFVNHGVADAGLEDLILAPNLGLLHWTETSLLGPTNAELMSATLAGKKYGKVLTSLLSEGWKSQFPTNDAKLLVYNDPTAWNSFWMQHDPGTSVPSVDFGTQSVIVVIAGWRNSMGYSVSISDVRWNYPNKNVVVSVLETTPTGPVPNPMSKPYTIVVAQEKVWTATVTWKTQPAQ